MAVSVSVIIPVYNLADCIENCIHSLQNQTYCDWEAIFVDDGSTDNSKSIILAAAENDPRIRYDHQKNSGVSVARNTGIAKAKGEFICFLDGDDFLHPQAIEFLIKGIQEQPYDMVSSFYTKTSLMQPDMQCMSYPGCIPLSYEEFLHLKGDRLIQKSVCFKIYRTGFIKSEPFCKEFIFSEDANYLIHLICKGMRIGFIDAVLYYYYERNESVCHRPCSLKNLSAVAAMDDAAVAATEISDKCVLAYTIETLFQELLFTRLCIVGQEQEKYVKKECNRYGRKWIRSLWHTPEIAFKNRLMYSAFLIFPYSYKAARILIDPTMKIFLKNQKQA